MEDRIDRLKYIEGIDDSLYPQTDQNYTVKVDLNYIQYVD